jgi:hypothetical protein
MSFIYRSLSGNRTVRAEVDRRYALPDMNRANNVWPLVPGIPSTLVPVVSRYSLTDDSTIRVIRHDRSNSLSAYG